MRSRPFSLCCFVISLGCDCAGVVDNNHDALIIRTTNNDAMSLMEVQWTMMLRWLLFCCWMSRQIRNVLLVRVRVSVRTRFTHFFTLFWLFGNKRKLSILNRFNGWAHKNRLHACAIVDVMVLSKVTSSTRKKRKEEAKITKLSLTTKINSFSNKSACNRCFAMKTLFYSNACSVLRFFQFLALPRTRYSHHFLRECVPLKMSSLTVRLICAVTVVRRSHGIDQ